MNRLFSPVIIGLEETEKMILALIFFLSIITVYYFIEYQKKRKPFVDRVNKFGGPSMLPIIGNLHHLMGSPTGL